MIARLDVYEWKGLTHVSFTPPIHANPNRERRYVPTKASLKRLGRVLAQGGFNAIPCLYPNQIWIRYEVGPMWLPGGSS